MRDKKKPPLAMRDKKSPLSLCEIKKPPLAMRDKKKPPLAERENINTVFFKVSVCPFVRLGHKKSVSLRNAFVYAKCPVSL